MAMLVLGDDVQVRADIRREEAIQQGAARRVSPTSSGGLTEHELRYQPLGGDAGERTGDISPFYAQNLGA